MQERHEGDHYENRPVSVSRLGSVSMARVPPSAIPRVTHRSAVCPAATRILQTNVNPSPTTDARKSTTGDVLLCEDDASCRGESEQDGVRREDDGDEVLGLLVHGLEIDLLASRPRKHGAKLEPDEETAEGEDEAEDPEHQGRADGPDGPEDGGGCGEDARADDTPNAGWSGSLVGRDSGT